MECILSTARKLFEMAPSLAWTLFAFVIYLIVKNDSAFCQNKIAETPISSPMDLVKQIASELSPSARTQLLNTLLKILSQSNAQPDAILSGYQSCRENCAMLTPNSLPSSNLYNVPVNIHPTPISSPLSPTGSSTGETGSPLSQQPHYHHHYKTNPESPQQNPNQLYSESLTGENSFHPCQSSPKEKPSQLSLEDIYNLIYAVNSPDQLSTSHPNPNPPSPSVSHTGSILPKSPGSVDIRILSPVEQKNSIYAEPQTNPFSTTRYYDIEPLLPLNLEINIPPAYFPEPKVTAVSPEHDMYPTTRDGPSSLKHILSLLLYTILSDDRNNDACCCNPVCYIPIPYPIPIPIQTPIFYNPTTTYIYGDEDDEDE